jgi:hypothetical protein
MEIQGFGGTLVGKTVWVHEDDWIPWEFLPNLPCRVLLYGADPPAVAFTDSWTYCIAPTSSKDWSCVATILKALSASAPLLVAWTSTVAMPPSFVRFVEPLPNVTRVQLGAEPPLLPDAVFGSPTLAFRALCERMPERGGHGSYAPPAVEAWADLTRTLSENGMSVMLTDVGEASWTLFWYKKKDSQGVSEAEAKGRAAALLLAAHRMLL